MTKERQLKMDCYLTFRAALLINFQLSRAELRLFILSAAERVKIQCVILCTDPDNAQKGQYMLSLYINMARRGVAKQIVIL